MYLWSWSCQTELISPIPTSSASLAPNEHPAFSSSPTASSHISSTTLSHPAHLSPSTSVSPNSSSEISRICSRIGCHNTLPDSKIYRYVQCIPCREKGRLQSKAYYQQRKRHEGSGGFSGSSDASLVSCFFVLRCAIVASYIESIASAGRN